MPNELKLWMRVAGVLNVVGLLAVGFLGVSADPGWADFKVYQEKGFRKVAEIVEKEEHEDGTFTVTAKRKGSEEVVVIHNVLRIEEATATKRFVPEYRAKATPTPVYVSKKLSTSGAPAPVEEAPRATSNEGLAAFLRNIPNMGIAILGVMVLVVVGFVIMKGWS